MKAAVEQEGGPFTLFGGEPLLVPLADLEDLFAWGFERWGRNSIQTNGTLLTDAHIELFARYKVSVGVSMDGPGPLNDVRWHGSLEKTREATARTQNAIERLCQAGIAPSVIVTLHRGNATEDKLPTLYDWVRTLSELGVRWMRLHLLESETQFVRERFALSDDENIAALVGFLALESKLDRLHFDIFEDMRRMLLGRDQSTTCIWNACDPYTTRAVRGVEGNGQRSNCGRTNKDGVDWVKAELPGYERYLALYHTPQDAGGCSGCRFFLMCKGQCPGTAIDGDWRNRTEHCAVWKHLYALLERELKASGEQPLSLSPWRGSVERGFLERWEEGENPSIEQIVRALEGPSDEVDWRRELAEIRALWPRADRGREQRTRATLVVE
jgi:uncharacterized protein